MTVNDLSVVLHLPRARTSEPGDSESYRLPEYAARQVLRVDDYPMAMDMFPSSEEGVSSYVVPVAAERGLWLDFNPAARASRNHLAIVVDVQGVNAITARPLESRAAPRLEKYSNSCPVHGVSFGSNRRCASCGWDWPGQNYVPTNGKDMPAGYVWLDGFRLPTGEVRQFVFTEDELRGVATAKMGDARDFALRVTLYRSSEIKRPPVSYRGGGMPTLGSFGGAPIGSAVPTRSMRSAPRSLDIAAGAKIRQRVYDDRCDFASYEPDPCGQVLINYVTEDVAQRIIESGRRTESTEGPLADVPTGHQSRPQGPHQQF